ncbi:hypothetical protein [Microvirga zambiensis]|uniref:hypothetical protein n=1 Tax=Microvirga zambiensis TaxID=1402137 RepID=UPI0019200251|nr:hypothetical protein [Microvirga zambiensis]
MAEPLESEQIPSAPKDLGDWIPLGDAVTKVCEQIAQRMRDRQLDHDREAAPHAPERGGES